MPDRATSIFENRWDFRHLAIWTAAALLLGASWVVPVTRGWWDALDLVVFRALNETVTWGYGPAAFWALTGDRLFDVFSAFVLGGFYLVIITRDGIPGFRHGLAFGAATIILLAVVVALQRELIEFPRLSPTLLLDNVHSIADYVSWSRAKEGSGSSFPGDHATVAMLLTLCWWLAYGWRVGLIATALTIIFSLPRMVAGAHWLTDAAVGGGFVVFVVAALMLGTPIFHKLYTFFRPWTDRLADWIIALLPRLREKRGTT